MQELLLQAIAEAQFHQGFIGALIGGALSVVGSVIGANSQKNAEERNAANQAAANRRNKRAAEHNARQDKHTVSTSRLSELVESAREAGLNPVSVMRNGGIGAFSTTTQKGWRYKYDGNSSYTGYSGVSPLGAGLSAAGNAVGNITTAMNNNREFQLAERAQSLAESNAFTAFGASPIASGARAVFSGAAPKVVANAATPSTGLPSLFDTNFNDRWGGPISDERAALDEVVGRAWNDVPNQPLTITDMNDPNSWWQRDLTWYDAGIAAEVDGEGSALLYEVGKNYANFKNSLYHPNNPNTRAVMTTLQRIDQRPMSLITKTGTGYGARPSPRELAERYGR